MKIVYNRLIILSFICLSLTGTAQHPIQIDLSGKKRFELGEPIILYAQIRNNTDSVIGLCHEWSGFSVYSITHSLPGDSLWHDPQTGQFIREVYSHTITPKTDGVYEVRNRTCPANSNLSLMIEPGKKLYYPMFISECPMINNDACKGRYDYLLPVGDYRLDANFSFSNGKLFRGNFSFEIEKSSPDLQKKIENFGELSQNYYSSHIQKSDQYKDKAYDPAISDPLYHYILESEDDVMTTKALLRIANFYGRNEWLLFWYFRVLEKADDQLLYYLINEFVGKDFFLYKDKAEALRIYDRLLRSLKKRDRVFSEYLLERLWARLHYAENERYRQKPFSIQEADLEGLKIYSAKKK